MVDIGATHNYRTSTKVDKMGLVVDKGVGEIKAVNLTSISIVGNIRGVQIKMDPFER